MWPTVFSCSVYNKSANPSWIHTTSQMLYNRSDLSHNHWQGQRLPYIFQELNFSKHFFYNCAYTHQCIFSVPCYILRITFTLVFKLTLDCVTEFRFLWYFFIVCYMYMIGMLQLDYMTPFLDSRNTCCKMRSNHAQSRLYNCDLCWTLATKLLFVRKLFC